MFDPGALLPERPERAPGCALCRLLWGCLASAWRLYKGPAVWGHFPKGVVFAMLSLTLATALYALTGWLEQVDWVLNAAILLLIMGLGPILYREDLPWSSAMLWVMILALVVNMPLDVLTRVFASSPMWGEASQITGTLSDFVGTWMTVTIFRLSIAKIRQTNKKYPLP